STTCEPTPTRPATWPATRPRPAGSPGWRRKRPGSSAARAGRVAELIPGPGAPGAYWPRAWTCEDGGSRRWGVPAGQPGPGIEPGERLVVEAVKDAFANDMVIRREPGELYALR